MKPHTTTIAAMLALSACTHARAPMPPDTSDVTAEQLDKVTYAVASCPQVRPLLAKALADDRVTMGELRGMLRRMRDASAVSDRLDSYDRARDAVGMRVPPRGASCDPRPATDLYAFIDRKA
jgi:hypothetical protein